MRPNFDLIIDQLLTDEIAIIPLNVAYALCAITDRGVARIAAIKMRPVEKTCSVLGTPLVFRALIDSPIGARVDELTLPVGLIAPVRCRAPRLPSGVGMNGTVNVFLNSGDFGMDLVAAAFSRKLLIVGSSANLSGTGNNYRLAEVEPEIRRAATVAVDGGSTRFQQFTESGTPVSSTNIDITNPAAARVIRKGLAFEQVCAELTSIGVQVQKESQ